MKIPGFIFILIGGTITFMSFRIGPKMVIFSWVGVIFIGYGIFDTVVKFTLQKKTTKRFQKELQKQIESPRVVKCPQCKTTVYTKVNFCYHCGCPIRARQKRQ